MWLGHSFECQAQGDISGSGKVRCVVEALPGCRTRATCRGQDIARRPGLA